MADPIDIAIQSIDARPLPPVDPLDTAMRSANSAQKLASDKLVELTDTTKQKALAKLPKTKDPELVKKEKEAEARQKAAQVKEDVLKKKSEALDVVKNLALGLAMSKLGKVQGVASSANSALGTAGAAAVTGMAVLGLLKKKKKPAAKQTQDMVKADQKTKEVEKERIQTSQENHQKNVEAFTYPLKPIDATPTQPEPPEIPIQSQIPPMPTPTPSPSPKPLADFYVIYTIDFGTYSSWTVYYKGQELWKSDKYKDTEENPIKVQEMEKELSVGTCNRAYDIINSGGQTEWISDPKIKNGCPNNFSIGMSNMTRKEL